MNVEQLKGCVEGWVTVLAWVFEEAQSQGGAGWSLRRGWSVQAV